MATLPMAQPKRTPFSAAAPRRPAKAGARRPAGALFVSSLLCSTGWPVEGRAYNGLAECAGAPGAPVASATSAASAASAASSSAIDPRRPASGLPHDAAGAAALPPGWVQVWVDLDPPVRAASLPGHAAGSRGQQHVQALQDAAMARLRELGAIERARVRSVRNALAVSLPCSALAAAAAIPGVRAVRPIRNLGRDPGKAAP